jgi:D-sedoheptulose 7-phosphate isomerase
VEEPGRAAETAFRRRREPGAALAGQAGTVARACRDLARSFRAGGRLLAFGNGGPTTDAQHVAVEFVHPVIVGKPALPALSLAGDGATLTGVAARQGFADVFAHQVGVLGRAEDAAIGISVDGHDDNVRRALEVAHAAGMTTLALTGGDGGALADSPAVDHVIVVPSGDPHVVKEVHVTAYHVLWELVHVFLEQPEADPVAPAGDVVAGPSPTGGVESLYPFLYAGSTDVDAVLDDVARSTAAKADDVVRLRDEVGAVSVDAVTACADDLARAFAGGATLLAFGNGGSSSDAQEVAQSFLDPVAGAALPALCLTNDVGVVTALSNDVDFSVVFARQVRAFGRAGDVALGLSTSGNSPNLLRAFEEAKQLGMLTVGLAGGDGGAMAASDVLDHCFVVPSPSVHRIQEVQTTLYHVLQELTQLALGRAGHAPRPPRPGRG